MGYLSCSLASSVVTCESQKKEKPLKPQIFRFQDLEAATHGFSVEALLGKGSHGCVYKGVLGNGMQVAVKRPSHGRRILQDQAAFDNEIRILSNLNNPRLVKLLGFCLDSKEKLLVVEFMQNGTLYDILHHGPEPLNWSKRVHLALQTARAVLDLHKTSPPIIHRDIKSSNVLIDRHWNAKLGDFGLALWGQNGVSIPPAGTLGYLDPEYTTPDMLSTKNDVFSFGILMLEIMSGRNAIDVHHNPPSILDWAIPLIKAGKSLGICDPKVPPPKSASALKQMAVLASRCVRSKSSRRPEMADVVQHLQEISRRICFPMFDGIARKMKRNVITSEKSKASVEKCKVAIEWKGCPRTPRVHDVRPRLRNGSPNTVSEPPGNYSVATRIANCSDLEAQDHTIDTGGRSLVDLFRESTQITSRKTLKAPRASSADLAGLIQDKAEVRQDNVDMKGKNEDADALGVRNPTTVAVVCGANSQSHTGTLDANL